MDLVKEWLHKASNIWIRQPVHVRGCAVLSSTSDLGECFSSKQRNGVVIPAELRGFLKSRFHLQNRRRACWSTHCGHVGRETISDNFCVFVESCCSEHCIVGTASHGSIGSNYTHFFKSCPLEDYFPSTSMSMTGIVLVWVSSLLPGTTPLEPPRSLVTDTGEAPGHRTWPVRETHPRLPQT